jgi:hypothetical protein
MENTTIIEKLIEKAEDYSKTTFELCKYNMVYKLADVFSSLAVRVSITVVIVWFSVLVNIGLSLWLGELLGETYYGFFSIALLYLVIALLLYIFKNEWIKKPISNFVIDQLVKK